MFNKERKISGKKIVKLSKKRKIITKTVQNREKVLKKRRKFVSIKARDLAVESLEKSNSSFLRLRPRACSSFKASSRESRIGSRCVISLSLTFPHSASKKGRNCNYNHVNMYETRSVQPIPCTSSLSKRPFVPIPLSPISIHFSTSPIPFWRCRLLHARRVAATTCDRRQRLFPRT
jgi:hypothetical protein